jgi:hypothetical protein
MVGYTRIGCIDCKGGIVMNGEEPINPADLVPSTLICNWINQINDWEDDESWLALNLEL